MQPDNPTANMAFNVEAVRAGLFAAAMDMADTMQEGGVHNAPACLMTGILEAAVQVWAQVSVTAGVPRQKSRKTLEKEVRTFFAKHFAVPDDSDDARIERERTFEGED